MLINGIDVQVAYDAYVLRSGCAVRNNYTNGIKINGPHVTRHYTTRRGLA